MARPSLWLQLIRKRRRMKLSHSKPIRLIGASRCRRTMPPGVFACGRRGIKEGGPPTRRVIEQHDLYILDIFPAPALYAGDTCRTFAVSRPTDIQHRAWELVVAAVRLGESMIKSGVEARQV